MITKDQLYDIILKRCKYKIGKIHPIHILQGRLVKTYGKEIIPLIEELKKDKLITGNSINDIWLLPKELINDTHL